MRFLDSNVLVYTADSSEPDKQAIARAVIASNAIESDIVISTQVLQEFYWGPHPASLPTGQSRT